MRILLALLCSIFTTGFLKADVEKHTTQRLYSHYDKITKDLIFLGEASVAPKYFIYLFTGSKDEFYRCYLVHIKHKNPHIMCIIDHDLAGVFFPFLVELKDKYDGPKTSGILDKLED